MSLEPTLCDRPELDMDPLC